MTIERADTKNTTSNGLRRRLTVSYSAITLREDHRLAGWHSCCGVHAGGACTGTAPRSADARRAFQAQQPSPSTAGRRGPCPGYVMGHVEPLACAGIDAPEKWQSIAEAKAKDTWERNDCELPVAMPRVALPLEPSMGSRGDAGRAEGRGQRASNRRPRSAAL
jgi:hypothetical protein